MLGLPCVRGSVCRVVGVEGAAGVEGQRVEHTDRAITWRTDHPQTQLVRASGKEVKEMCSSPPKSTALKGLGFTITVTMHK